MKTLLEVLRAGTAWLEEKGTDAPRCTMQSLLCHVLGCDRTRLYLDGDRPLPEEELARLRDLLKRRIQGEPLQHLIGSVEFFRRIFKCDARALIPRPETEELTEIVLDMIPKREGLRILDMGTGSGVLGITLALELADLHPVVVLADVSQAALSLALENATSLGACVNTVHSDLFSAWSDENALTPNYAFDVVVANLPYIPDGEELSVEVRSDPSSALYGGPHGTEIIDRFLDEVRPHFSPEALIALEIGWDQGEHVLQSLQRLGYTSPEVKHDLSGKARFPVAHFLSSQA